MENVETITVVPNKPYDTTVLLYERAREHPNGAAYITAREGREVEVARTERVMELIRTGRIREVSTSQPEAEADEPSTDQPEADPELEEKLKAYAEAHTVPQLAELVQQHGLTFDGKPTKIDVVRALHGAGHLDFEGDDAGA